MIETFSLVPRFFLISLRITKKPQHSVVLKRDWNRINLFVVKRIIKGKNNKKNYPQDILWGKKNNEKQ